jgi:hypothetical protein
MKLELSDGKIIHSPGQHDIDDAIARIGSTLDHCILSEGDDYIQTAGGVGQFLIQYQAGGASFESTSSAVSAEQVKEIFRDYLAGGDSCKTMISFQSMTTGGGTEAVSQTGGSRDPASFTPGSLKQTFTNAAKQEAVNSVSYMIRRFVRRLFRGVF